MCVCSWACTEADWLLWGWFTQRSLEGFLCFGLWCLMQSKYGSDIRAPSQRHLRHRPRCACAAQSVVRSSPHIPCPNKGWFQLFQSLPYLQSKQTVVSATSRLLSSKLVLAPHHAFLVGTVLSRKAIRVLLLTSLCIKQLNNLYSEYGTLASTLMWPLCCC